MLSDYIAVYWPHNNTWSFPHFELREYVDLCPVPQDIKLQNGAVVRGIPLVHFGTWGAVGVDVTEVIRSIAAEPYEMCNKLYKSKRAAAETAALFKMLAMQYPIRSVRMFAGMRSLSSAELNVPAKCIRRARSLRGVK